MNAEHRFDPERDLILERVVDVPRARVWAAWTRPELLRQWFAPKPWTTGECEIDLRPGGRFRAVMWSPEGDEHPSDGCLLEVVENERLVFTDTLGADYRPLDGGFFTGAILLAPSGRGTRYTAIARHKDAETRKQHEEMGFHEGWSQCLDQLVELMGRT